MYFFGVAASTLVVGNRVGQSVTQKSTTGYTGGPFSKYKHTNGTDIEWLEVIRSVATVRLDNLMVMLDLNHL